jgi:hypothetical protein
MLFSKVDEWIGRTLFVPPIIKLCQVTRQSQYAVSRLFWFVAALDAFYYAETLFSSVLWGAMSVVMMVTAVRRADSPTASFMFFRLLAAFMFVLEVLLSAGSGEWEGAEFWILILVAEYAATIRTIPPQAIARAAAAETSSSS